jgi:hypothetical protein
MKNLQEAIEASLIIEAKRCGKVSKQNTKNNTVTINPSEDSTEKVIK